MKILITGINGQLGKALIEKAPKKFKNSSISIIGTTRNDLDLIQPINCKRAIQIHKPDWVINSGAYTAVDNAEKEEKIAMRINAEAPRAFAEAIKEYGGQLLQLSTDFVFDGNQGSPYKTNQKRNPINTYGKTKSIGEEAVENILFDSSQGTILRTSWLMGNVGKNFALTMLKLHAEKDKINVVSDQIGSPTTTFSLASSCWTIIERKHIGNQIPNILHWCDSGVASWFDVAIYIGEIGYKLGLINKQAIVNPISSEQYQTLANRPSFSVLDTRDTIEALNLKPSYWRSSIFNLLQTKSP
tara:strand:+ start:7168 stop:8067 length:900 start_codon:yes stop_codon:yes gene_type:complete